MLAYRTKGNPAHPAVLFLHGFMGSGADWETIEEALVRSFYCIDVDLPGHGRSVGLAGPEAYTMAGAAAALGAVLDAAEVARAAVVGYSMGGRLALYFALHHPDRCRRLVLESASPGLASEIDRDARRGVDEARAVRLETGDFEMFLKAWYTQSLFATLGRHAGLVDAMIAGRLQNDPQELARSLRGMGTGRQPALWERLAALRVPTLAVAGALDGKYVEVAERMAVLIPNVRTAIMPNAGHNVHAEFPETYQDLLKAFLTHPQ